MSQLSFKGIKSLLQNKKNEFNTRTSMNGLLKQAYKSLNEFLHNQNVLNEEKEFCKKMLRHAEGIALITEINGGFGFGMKTGTGIIICRTNNNDNWSAPIAVMTGGVSIGLQLGINKIDHIIIMTSKKHIKTFMRKGQIQLHGSANTTIINQGRDAKIGIGISDKAISPIISYSFGVKGLYGGITVGGNIIYIRKECNKKFYDKEFYEDDINLDDILNGNIRAPFDDKNYCSIIKLLNDYSVMENYDENDIINTDFMDTNEKTPINQVL